MMAMQMFIFTTQNCKACIMQIKQSFKSIKLEILNDEYDGDVWEMLDIGLKLLSTSYSNKSSASKY